VQKYLFYLLIYVGVLMFVPANSVTFMNESKHTKCVLQYSYFIVMSIQY